MELFKKFYIFIKGISIITLIKLVREKKFTTITIDNKDYTNIIYIIIFTSFYANIYSF